MIKDPTDMAAVTFRIQCYIDMGKYEEAEQICTLLAQEVQDTFLEKIEKAKAGGENLRLFLSKIFQKITKKH